VYLRQNAAPLRPSSWIKKQNSNRNGREREVVEGKDRERGRGKVDG